MSVSGSREKAWDCIWNPKISWKDARAGWQGYFSGLVYLTAIWPISYSVKRVLVLFPTCCVFHCHTFTKLDNIKHGRNFLLWEESQEGTITNWAWYKTGFRDQNPPKWNVQDQNCKFRFQFQHCLDLQALWWEPWAFPDHSLWALWFSQVWLKSSCSALLHIITLGILIYQTLSEHTYNTHWIGLLK